MVAIVSLNDDKLMQFSEVNGLDETNKKKLIQCDQVQYGILKQLERAANTNNLDNIEIIMKVHIVSEKFSAQNGLLTNTHKTKREAI